MRESSDFIYELGMVQTMSTALNFLSISVSTLMFKAKLKVRLMMPRKAPMYISQSKRT